jgi:hypothetical protein
MTTGRGQSKRFPPQANTHTTNYIETTKIYIKKSGGTIFDYPWVTPRADIGMTG